MIIYVDVDETICRYDGPREYPAAIPIREHINKINKLYDEGHNIIFFTARGMGRSNNSVEFAYSNF